MIANKVEVLKVGLVKEEGNVVIKDFICSAIRRIIISFVLRQNFDGGREEKLLY